MKRLGVGVLLVAAVLSLGIVVIGRYAMPERVYTVAEIVGGLRRAPGQWAGRTVLVRGIVIGGSAASTCAQGTGAFGISCAPRAWMTLGSTGGSTGQAGWITLFPTAPVPALPARIRVLGTNGGGFIGVAPGGKPLRVSRGALLWLPTRGWGSITPIFVGAFHPAEELTVSVRPGSLPLATRLRQAVPDAAYTAPMVGPLVSRFFPRDGSQVYRVRLLDPRACPVRAFAPCADATLVS